MTAPAGGAREVLRLQGITRRFGPVLANDGIDLVLREGEIVALLGENGAGKTTLMNVLYGLLAPDAGEIWLRGRPYRPTDPSAAIRAGIGMVHQHFMLIPTFSVVENVVLGAEPTRGASLDLDAARQAVRDLSDRYGLEVDPDARVRDLPVGVQQRVEILKALYRQADLLILDEPTAVLAPPEVQQLFGVIRELVARGRAVIFISHKLREVLAIADRISVLRRGAVVGSTTPAEATEGSLAMIMVGRPVEPRVDRRPATPGSVVLRTEKLRVVDQRGTAVDGVDLTVRAGEIVGVAGVEGNGQTELVEALTGLRPIASGRVTLDGVDVTHAGPGALAERGIAHVPEDRQKYGLVLGHPLADNLVLSRFNRPPFARRLRRLVGAVRAFARRLVTEYDISVPSVDVPAGTLSGGNQQRAVVARELARQPRLLISAQPTRGVDVGATELIHQRIIAARDAGAAVLLVSSELDEIVALADRIVVMYGGRITARRAAGEASRDELGLLIGGARHDGAPPPAASTNRRGE